LVDDDDALLEADEGLTEDDPATELELPVHVPKPDWHPVPHQAAPLPQYPYWLQQFPKAEFKQVAPPFVGPQLPSVLTLTLEDGDGAAELALADDEIWTLEEAGLTEEETGLTEEEEAGCGDGDGEALILDEAGFAEEDGGFTDEEATEFVQDPKPGWHPVPQ